MLYIYIYIIRIYHLYDFLNLKSTINIFFKRFINWFSVTEGNLARFRNWKNSFRELPKFEKFGNSISCYVSRTNESLNIINYV